MKVVRKKQLNAYQISQEVSLDHKAVLHHLKVLEKNNLVVKIGARYGGKYFLRCSFSTMIYSLMKF